VNEKPAAPVPAPWRRGPIEGVSCSAAILALVPLLTLYCADAPPATSRKDIVSTGKPRYSMHKEETIIRDFFQDRRGGFFLDVGCWHPIIASNTYYLEEHLGWSGFGVDALPEMARKWKRNRPASKFFNYIVIDHADTVESFYRMDLSDVSSIQKPPPAPSGGPSKVEEIKVPTITLTKLLDEHGVSKIDFLSIDIEGAEPLALAGFDIDRFKPELVCIEAKPRNREFIMKYFADHGYERIERYLKYDDMNYYFTPKVKAQ